MLREFTGPEEVERQRERMWAVPLDGGSTADSTEFLTAKPMPCSLGSSGSFPCQKNMYSCSLRLLFEGSSVSCSAAISMLSLLSLWLMMAFSEVINLLQIIREARKHCPNIPACKSQEMFLLSLL